MVGLNGIHVDKTVGYPFLSVAGATSPRKQSSIAPGTCCRSIEQVKCGFKFYLQK
jgi:hypothetical protein